MTFIVIATAKTHGQWCNPICLPRWEGVRKLTVDPPFNSGHGIRDRQVLEVMVELSILAVLWTAVDEYAHAHLDKSEESEASRRSAVTAPGGVTIHTEYGHYDASELTATVR